MQGIKNICDSLPTKSWQYDPNEDDGWIKVSCEDTFEANSIEEAKKIAGEYDCGVNGVFSVFDDKGKLIFTEEDLENDIPKYTVVCVCNTEVEVEEHSVGECPNCHRGIDDRGVIY